MPQYLCCCSSQILSSRNYLFPLSVQQPVLFWPTSCSLSYRHMRHRWISSFTREPNSQRTMLEMHSSLRTDHGTGNARFLPVSFPSIPHSLYGAFLCNRPVPVGYMVLRLKFDKRTKIPLKEEPFFAPKLRHPSNAPAPNPFASSTVA